MSIRDIIHKAEQAAAKELGAEKVIISFSVLNNLQHIKAIEVVDSLCEILDTSRPMLGYKSRKTEVVLRRKYASFVLFRCCPTTSCLPLAPFIGLEYAAVRHHAQDFESQYQTNKMFRENADHILGKLKLKHPFISEYLKIKMRKNEATVLA